MFRFGCRFQFCEISCKIAIFFTENFSPLRISISLRNQVEIQRFLTSWNWFEVFFLKIPFSPISTINFSSDLIKFEDYVKKFLISLWIRLLFTIIPLNSSEFSKIGKFGIIFDAIPHEIDDLVVSSRQRYRGGAYLAYVGDTMSKGDSILYTRLTPVFFSVWDWHHS